MATKCLRLRKSKNILSQFAKDNNIRLKGHCLMYNSFNPEWMPEDKRSLRIAVEKRSKELGERYGEDFVDLDVINEMIAIYKNAFNCKDDYYAAPWSRNLSITDDPNHEKWCFDLAKKYFPHSTLFWNEGVLASFGKKQADYNGNRSWYYLILKRWLAEGAPIEGIGMQFHLYLKENDIDLVNSPWSEDQCTNVLRQMDVFETYSEFNLPIHISEISLPSWSNTNIHLKH